MCNRGGGMKGPPTVLLHKSFRIEFESSSNRVRIELGAPTAYKLEEKSRENFLQEFGEDRRCVVVVFQF